MQNLIKALSLLGLMILVSCGSSEEEMDCSILNLNFGDTCTISTDRGEFAGIVGEDCECLFDDERESGIDNEREENASEDCYTLLYPVSVMLPDGTTATADDAENLESIYSDWFEVNPDSAQEPEFIFPLEVTVEDSDQILELNSYEELERLENFCQSDDDGNNDEGNSDEGNERGECFELVYPIGVDLPDGTSQRATNEEELEDIYDAWFDANPDSREEPSLIFPIQIILESVDRPVDVQSEAELERLYNRCDYDDEGDEDRFECFEIVFPVGVTIPDGTTQRAADEEALERIFERWFNANPNSEEEPTLIYPIQIVVDDIDNPLDVANEAELENIYERCEQSSSNGDFDCPELRANIGDPCRLDNGATGTITQACTCE